MNIDLSQLTSYLQDEQRAVAAMQEAKSRLEYARLQAKQTRQMAARAKRDPHVKALVKAFSPSADVEVMPAPGCIYITFQASGLLKLCNMAVPGELGWEEHRTEQPSPRSTHHYYRHPDAPGLILIVTEWHV